MVPPPVAVIDIGSNTIKVLVATRSAAGEIVALDSLSLDARISAGITRVPPQLSEEGMARGVAAIQELLARVAAHAPARTLLVATSAVRDAVNGTGFRQRVLAATGHSVQILTGAEEAAAIGRGLLTEPALAGCNELQVFDLGGGSLECLSFRNRTVENAVSLQLGCVRLTEQLVSDPAAPFPAKAEEQIGDLVLTTLAASGFTPGGAGITAFVTGGTAATVRAILGARIGRTAEEMPAIITVPDLRDLLAHLGAMPLAERQRVPGLPAARADVFPTALATILALAEAGGFASFRHSFRNLRWGLASRLLESP